MRFGGCEVGGDVLVGGRDVSVAGPSKMGRLGRENALVNEAMRRVMCACVASIVDNEVCANSNYAA